MKPDKEAALRKIELATQATQSGKVFFTGSPDEFDRGCDHVSSLLMDANLLYSKGSYASAAFLSITAIEETAKIEISIFRQNGKTAPTNRSKDHLFSHKNKHSIALQEVIVMGTRLPDAIGEQRVRELLDWAESGKLVELRESALYVTNVDGKFLCPADQIDQPLSRELLLLALEVWNDRLVGLSNHTYDLDRDLMDVFAIIASAPPIP